MEKNSVELLPHLSKEIISDIDRKSLDSYAIALEGWRRGLLLKWYRNHEKMEHYKIDKPGYLFSLTFNTKTHFFYRTNGDKNTNDAIDLLSNKEKLNRLLKNKGFLVIDSKESIEKRNSIDRYKVYVLGNQVVGAIKVVSSGDLDNYIDSNDRGIKTYDVLDELPIIVKDLAVNAINSIPGLEHGSVEFITTVNKLDIKHLFILGINSTPEIGSVLFPTNGLARDIPTSIIDYYFPETVKYKENNRAMYFDYKQIISPLIKGFSNATNVTQLGTNNFKVIEITAEGSLQDIDFYFWIKNIALKNDLMGYVSHENSNSIELIVAGSEKNIAYFKEKIYDELSKRSFIKLQEKVSEKPVKAGFEIIKGKDALIEQIQSTMKEFNDLQNQKLMLQKDYFSMLNSLSWRITFPIRKITAPFKKLYRWLKNN